MSTSNYKSRSRSRDITSEMSVRSSPGDQLRPRSGVKVPPLDLSFLYDNEKELPSESQYFAYHSPKEELNHQPTLREMENGPACVCRISITDGSRSKSPELDHNHADKPKEMDVVAATVEYLRLIKVAKENVNTIIDYDIALERQDKLTEDLMEQADYASTSNQLMTNEVMQARRFHENFRAEAQRCRVTHKSSELSAIIIANDNVNVQEEIWKVRQDVVEIKDRRGYRGVEGLRAHTWCVNEAARREQLDNKLREEKLEVLKNTMNECKRPPDDNITESAESVNYNRLPGLANLKPRIHRRQQLLPQIAVVDNNKMSEKLVPVRSGALKPDGKKVSTGFLPPINNTNIHNATSGQVATLTNQQQSEFKPRPPTTAPRDGRYQRRNIKR